MYLLNHKTQAPTTPPKRFTFHYVSIKSDTGTDIETVTQRFTFHYVSIKSYRSLITPPSTLLFTFHYVSIKSAGTVFDLNNQTNLHSTMYLLNLLDNTGSSAQHKYLHSTMYLLNRKMCKNKQKEKQFTFHYVSIKSTN